MVLKKKKVVNRSIGFQVSIIPRAPRSTRRWALGRKTADEHVCAIELLASLAGKLLQETESSASNPASEEDDQLVQIKDIFVKKTLSKDKPPKVEEQGSCEASVVVSGEEGQQKNPFKASPELESDNHWECSSTFVDSPHPYIKKENRDVIITSEISNKVESFLKSEASDSEIKLSVDHKDAGGIAMVKNSSCLEPLAERSARLAAVPSPNFQRQKLLSTWQKRDPKSGGRDEKVSTFSKSSTNFKSLRHPRRALDNKVRKLLASKHWKVSPQLKNCECDDVARKSLNQTRRISYKRERYHRDFICKRRKLLDGGLVMTSFLNSKIATNSEKKEKSYNMGGSFKNSRGEMGISSSVLGSQASFSAKNAHVKFSIKSFRIPELLIDVPETATVGSLKRTIVEAVTAILGGGLHVGILLHGKKVGDDNRTLQQSGISCDENLNSLGFMLEPNLTQLIAASEQSALVESASTTEPLTCTTRCNTADTMVASDSSQSHNPSSNVCKKYEEQVSPVQASDSGEVSLTEKPTLESQALVSVAADTTQHLPLPLAIIPVTQKSKRLELSQRRIRRPFSVFEVEALVEAVEQLGTGRWRDVKLRAFGNADHRTYVDLKDKWKTLVHTASISPQQRRGEPVPQELLDRVMTAHSYWSQQQQGKQLQPSETLRIADVPADCAVEVEENE